MSGDSVPLALPLSRLATGACEATALYRELRKPLLRYLVCLGLSSDEAQDVVQDAFLILHRHLAAGGRRKIFAAGCFAWRTIRPETARSATTGVSARRVMLK